MISSVTVTPPYVPRVLAYHHLIISAVYSHQSFIQSSRLARPRAGGDRVQYPADMWVGMIRTSEGPTLSGDFLPSSLL